ncbi:MAG: hypothetical protein ACRDCG_02845 [Mycoplasmoidaceae bacterium]
MSKNKISIEISEDLFKDLEKKYKAEENSLKLINIWSTDNFIEYILKNFSNSSKQFEGLSNEQKEALNNIDISKIDMTELFNQMTEMPSIKNQKKNNNNEENNGNLKN